MNEKLLDVLKTKIIETLKIIDDYKKINQKKLNLCIVHKAKSGSIQPTLEKHGVWQIYKDYETTEDGLLRNLGIDRCWDDFGSDVTIDILTIVETVINTKLVIE